MKKILSVLLALVMAMSLTTLAWADGKTTINDLQEGVNFGYRQNVTEKGAAVEINGGTVQQWADAYVYQDTTINGVTFENGAVFNIGVTGVKLTLIDCTFKACDQKVAAEDLGLNYEGTGNDATGGNNVLTNTGAGMCLDVETFDREGVQIDIQGCKFIGDGGADVPRAGYKYNANGTVAARDKARGHGIVLNAISGHCEGSPVLNIEGCTIENARGNAIQLYGNTGTITIKDTEIKSWGQNSTPKDYAIRGDFPADGTKTITLEDVTFGLDENKTGDSGIGHINVGSFSGNTDGTKIAGTYYVTEQPPAPTPDPTPTPDPEPAAPAHTNRRYPATTTTTAETPEKGNDVTSAKTFDAGIALYIGLSALSLSGSAVLMGKKKEF